MLMEISNGFPLRVNRNFPNFADLRDMISLRASFKGNIKLYQMTGQRDLLRISQKGILALRSISNLKVHAKGLVPACHLKFLICYQITPNNISDQIYLMISNYCHIECLQLLYIIRLVVQHSPQQQ